MPGTRTYLAADDRRSALLDAVGQLLERGGLDAITMVAVADEAGISRTLVYKFFPDLEQLLLAYFDDRSARYFQMMDERGDEGDRSYEGARLGLARIDLLSTADLRAIEAVMGSGTHPVLRVVRQRFRDVLVQRWQPVIDQSDDGELLQAAIWALVQPFLTLALAVRLGELQAATASRIWNGLMTGVLNEINPDA